MSTVTNESGATGLVGGVGFVGAREGAQTCGSIERNIVRGSGSGSSNSIRAQTREHLAGLVVLSGSGVIGVGVGGGRTEVGIRVMPLKDLTN
jgi:hypothetical protein